ncbi:GDSL esterase/lipase At5g62930-like [Wolffia australiana]
MSSRVRKFVPSRREPYRGWRESIDGGEEMRSTEILGKRPRIVLFGDSITEQSFSPGGWGASLAEAYSRKADIIVRGYGGYNTRWAMYLLGHIFPSDDPQPPVAATIFFGANDAALLERHSERQHVPIEEYKDNLRQIVQHLKNLSPTMLVVLITPPPVDEDGRMKFALSKYGAKVMELPERTNKVTGLYAKECVSLASILRVPCVDIWSQMQFTDGWQEKFLRDGLHLTEEGNGAVFREVARVFRESGLSADSMPYDFPHHSVICGEKPEQTFKWSHVESSKDDVRPCTRQDLTKSPSNLQERRSNGEGVARTPRTPRSKILKHFTKIGQSKYACEVCRRRDPTAEVILTRSKDSSTNVFWRHLHRAHRKLYDEIKGTVMSQCSMDNFGSNPSMTKEMGGQIADVEVAEPSPQASQDQPDE